MACEVVHVGRQDGRQAGAASWWTTSHLVTQTSCVTGFFMRVRTVRGWPQRSQDESQSASQDEPQPWPPSKPWRLKPRNAHFGKQMSSSSHLYSYVVTFFFSDLGMQ